MRTYYIFQSKSAPGLRGFTDAPDGEGLPAEDGPWTPMQVIGPRDEWTLNISRAVVVAGILENGFYLWGPVSGGEVYHPVIESDRVEGTPVFDRDNNRIGTIKRLLIEKVSGRVLYVDVTFGGLLGIGTHHHTVPWDKLNYDKELGGYHTHITEEQIQNAPAFYDRDRALPSQTQEQEMKAYWQNAQPGS